MKNRVVQAQVFPASWSEWLELQSRHVAAVTDRLHVQQADFLDCLFSEMEARYHICLSDFGCNVNKGRQKAYSLALVTICSNLALRMMFEVILDEMLLVCGLQDETSTNGGMGGGTYIG